MADPFIAGSHTAVPLDDPAYYLVDPGSVSISNIENPSAGSLTHPRPYIVSDKQLFVFPVGAEGFTRSGQATLGLHHYIGGGSVDGVTVHYEEARIELSGMFPGLTAQQSMVDCINILRSKPKAPGLVLYVPGVFNKTQFVLAENWNFTHDADDRTHSIDYQISFVRIGEGDTVSDTPGTPPPANPTVNSSGKGQPTHLFTVKDGAQTLRQIAKIVYGNQEAWQRLVDLNAGQLGDWQRGNARNTMNNLPTYQLPTYRFPIGTKFRY